MKKMQKFAAKGILVVILLLAVALIGSVMIDKVTQLQNNEDGSGLPYSYSGTVDLSRFDEGPAIPEDDPTVWENLQFWPDEAVKVTQPQNSPIVSITSPISEPFTAPATVRVTADIIEDMPVYSIDLFPNNDQPKEGEALLSPETIEYGHGPTGRNFTVNLDQLKEKEEADLWIRFKSWVRDLLI